MASVVAYTKNIAKPDNINVFWRILPKTKHLLSQQYT